MVKTRIDITIEKDTLDKFRKRYVFTKGDLSEAIELLIKDALKEKKIMMLYNPKLKKVLMKNSVEV